MQGGIAMKGLIRWGFAAAFVMATAIPALAASWDICIEPADINSSDQVTIRGTAYSEFIAVAAPIFPAGTFTVGQRASCTTSATSVGLFFERASAVGNLPADQTQTAPDLYLAEWYFKFKTGGAFSTMGPVRGVGAGSTYSQTITGVLGGKTTVPGKALITVLSSSSGLSGLTVDAFRVTVP
jgi:hypothetical protein